MCKKYTNPISFITFIACKGHFTSQAYRWLLIVLSLLKSLLFMKLRLLFKYIVLVSCLITTSFFSAHSQSTDPKFNVMMQGFWWDSYQDPTVSSEGGLYNFLKARAGQLKATGIDVVWTPPPSDGSGMAYFPQQLYVYSNAHGSEAQLRAMLAEFSAKNIHGMADIVANHRNGTTAWSDFTNPTWGCDVIVDNDEVKGVAGQVQPCSNQLDEGEGFAGVRDMNHKSTTVQNGYKTYLTNLKGLGFDSWRWDFTKGYPAKYVGEYNATSFSVINSFIFCLLFNQCFIKTMGMPGWVNMYASAFIKLSLPAILCASWFSENVTAYSANPNVPAKPGILPPLFNSDHEPFTALSSM